MNGAEWSRITALFHAACERPPDERRQWLSAHCADEATRREVAAMLSTYEADPRFMEEPEGIAAAVAEALSAGAVGRRVGGYRLLTEIGRGGMGIVYEARRDEDDFDRRAAIKILPAWSGTDLADRFLFERRVLAGLDHPGIARLLDSGSTNDGVPYFVMEYVDGRPIDVWCREQGLSTAARIDLIERVCDALAYAHQHLVVHRDVKPANLLVTADGQPKLLDFGIAALLTADGEAAGLTRIGHHSFTPEYASPEQTRGERVTTATDVYSLGVVMYTLLAGRPPYDLPRQSPLEALRVVCEVEPPLMSTVADRAAAPLLRGDLDAIVRKALRKPPAERYRTVAELANDIQAWHAGRPVSAARQSTGYRARRFVRRHRAVVVAGVALVATLAIGVAATLWQARIAARERDRAQKRFEQVQQFSRSLLLDVHSALQAVPGATDARRVLLDRAVKFLDGLAADASDDDNLLLELASGYQQLANVQGSQRSDNVGNTAAATVSLEKAATLIKSVRQRRPGDPQVLIRAMHLAYDLAQMHQLRGDAVGDLRAEHETLLHELERRETADPAMRISIAKGYSDVGSLRTAAGDFARAEQAYRESVRRFEALDPGVQDVAALRDHGYALKRLGAVLLRADKDDESEASYRRALALDEAVLARDNRPDTRFDMTFTLSDLGLVQFRRNAISDAVALWQRALEMRQALASADPKNTRAVAGVAALLGRLGNAAHQQRNFAPAVARYREELQLRESLIAIQGPLPLRVSERAWARINLGWSLMAWADSVPRDPGNRARIDEVKRLVNATGRNDGRISVTAGSEPGFHERYDALKARLERY